MTTDLSTTASPDFVETLTQAVAVLRSQLLDQDAPPASQRPTAVAVVKALLQAEKAAKQQHQRYPLQALLGHWRLGFTTTGKVHLQQDGITGKKGFYVPSFTPAQISFTAPAGTELNPTDLAIGNQIQLGGLQFRVTGPARYLEKKNLLAFDFNQMQLSLFGKSLYQGGFPGRKTQPGNFQDQPIGKLPFFAFFYVTEDFIAARGRGGGLAIWVRES